MIKYGSYETTLNVPFEKFSDEFNQEIHFGIKGIKKRFYNNAKIEIHNFKHIRVFERKDIYCNYYPDKNGNTIVEYTAEMNIFMLISWVISLFFIVGFFLLPLVLFGRRWSCSLNRKRVIKHWHNYLLINIPKLSDASTKTKDTDNKNINLKEETIPNKNIPNKLPPPVNINKIPPPLPRIVEMKDFYVVINEKQIGPLNIEKINLLIEINQIDATTLMWKDGLSEWLPAIQIDEFKTSF